MSLPDDILVPTIDGAHYLGICLQVLRKTIKSVRHDSPCPEKDSNRAPPAYESRELPLCKPARHMTVFSWVLSQHEPLQQYKIKG
jgi:hypothetical protein